MEANLRRRGHDGRAASEPRKERRNSHRFNLPPRRSFVTLHVQTRRRICTLEHSLAKSRFVQWILLHHLPRRIHHRRILRWLHTRTPRQQQDSKIQNYVWSLMAFLCYHFYIQRYSLSSTHHARTSRSFDPAKLSSNGQPSAQKANPKLFPSKLHSFRPALDNRREPLTRYFYIFPPPVYLLTRSSIDRLSVIYFRVVLPLLSLICRILPPPKGF